MIKNKQHFVNSLWNWDFLSSQLPGKVRVSDVDGILRSNGKFLVIETKFPGSKVPTGQKLLFEDLAKTGFFTIFIVWGKQPKNEGVPVVENIQIISPNNYSKILPFNSSKFKTLVNQWYNRAGNK